MEITEDGFLFYELGLVEKRSQKGEAAEKMDRVTPDHKQVNIVDLSSNGSSSAEEIPQDYKPAHYLRLHQK